MFFERTFFSYAIPALKDVKNFKLIVAVALLFFNPLWEAPKNIFIVLAFFLVCSLAVNKDVPKLHKIDWVMLCLPPLVLLLSEVARYEGRPVSGMTEAMRCTVVFLFFGWFRWSAQEIRRILLFAILATFIAGTIWFVNNYSQWLVNPNVALLELGSVGHTNQSAIYINLIIGLLLAVLLSSSIKTILSKSIIFILLIVMVFFLFMTLSKISIGVAVLMLSLSLFFLIYRYGRLYALLIGVLFLFGVGVSFSLVDNSLSREFAMLSDSNNLTSFRLELFRSAFLAWLYHPIVGWGPDNFILVNEEFVRNAAIEVYGFYSPEDYHFSSHAHGLFQTHLAERGLLGIIWIFSLIFLWALFLWRSKPDAKSSEIYRMIWWGSFFVLVVNVLNGTFNTTLHHEHAILSYSLLGLHLAQWRGDKANSNLNFS